MLKILSCYLFYNGGSVLFVGCLLSNIGVLKCNYKFIGDFFIFLDEVWFCNLVWFIVWVNFVL